MTQIQALSPLDGRYAKLNQELSPIFSEYGLIYHRVFVEIQWLKCILKDLSLCSSSLPDLAPLDSVISEFHAGSAQSVKDIEKTTNHDVKAVEYYIKDCLDKKGLSEIREWVHFACTSEDINNTAYALMLDKGKEKMLLLVNELMEAIEEKALLYKAIPMMSRTHGQAASPTTTGKEFVNFAWRLSTETRLLESTKVYAKINGATGNYNAHHFVFPDIDWLQVSENFIKNYLGLEPILFTTQINPNTSISHILHCLIRMAAIVIDLDRDMWGYISRGYFTQEIKKGETGSSTMPHKVNPIDFENSEGNMGLAISMMEHLAVKLQTSRFQRDLSDSTVLRSLGTAFGYFTIGIKNCLKGLSKIHANPSAMAKDLDANQALLAEPFQTAMRVFGEENPYERLKDLTRGQEITRASLQNFVKTLEKVPESMKAKMGTLAPETYTGLAEKLVDTYFAEKKGITEKQERNGHNNSTH